jgi:hypothetical protein
MPVVLAIYTPLSMYVTLVIQGVSEKVGALLGVNSPAQK